MRNADMEEVDIADDVAINRKTSAWAANSIPTRNRWRGVILQKLKDCESALPLVQRMSLRLPDYWSIWSGTIFPLLLPPFVLLAAGCILAWIMKGFRMSA
jgi:hypothetical protein